MSDSPTNVIDPPTNVIEALARVMEELPGIAKKRHQSEGREGKGITYAYRGIEEITRETQGLFARFGVVVVPRVRSLDTREIVVNGNPWTDTTVVTDWDIYGPGGTTDVIHATTAGIGRDNSDKGANKAATQSLKYLLLPLLCVSDSADDADGTTHPADVGTTSRQVQRGDGGTPHAASEKQIGFLTGLYRKAGLSEDEAKKLADDVLGHEISDWGDLSSRDASAVIDALKVLSEDLVPGHSARPELQGLKEIIDSLPQAQRAACRAYLRAQFGEASTMTDEQLEQAIVIAAGWPQTAPFDVDGFDPTERFAQ